MQLSPDSPPTALVVEDDPHIGLLLKFMLERAGYRVAVCSDGRAAQAHIQSQARPTVTLLDVMLPYLDGMQLLALLRQQPGWEGVPVLMLTAKAQESDIARALAAGADDYILKPFEPQQLLERLRRFLPAAP